MFTRYWGLLWLILFALLIIVLSPITQFSFATPVSDWQGWLFTYLSYSAGHQGFVATLLILIVWCFGVKRIQAQTVHLLAFLGVLLISAFALKSGLKELTTSPRPYVEWLVERHLLLHAEQFYQLSQHAQSELIQQASQQLSPWRSIHWQGETDYSFPSGHTIFVSICIAFFGQHFLNAKRYLPAALLIVWGLGVTTSRLWIGMHRPIDLFGAILCVFVMFALFSALSVRFPCLRTYFKRFVKHSKQLK